jgi:hypothetical protein
MGTKHVGLTMKPITITHRDKDGNIISRSEAQPVTGEALEAFKAQLAKEQEGPDAA